MLIARSAEGFEWNFGKDYPGSYILLHESGDIGVLKKTVRIPLKVSTYLLTYLPTAITYVRDDRFTIIYHFIDLFKHTNVTYLHFVNVNETAKKNNSI